ncbi:MAG: glycosyltransferase [Holophagae bacterium]|nr:MAG: glycosyltransferase [Holophagae bacterium]
MMGPDDGHSNAAPLVPTVVVPNLNNARFLQRTLDSIAAQSVPDLDVVIVDGGSTDGSVEIIRSWAEANGARWISEPDGGQAQAINKGFRMARGEIVTWLNSDDLFPPGAVSRAIWEFESDPELDFIWGFCLLIDAEGRPLRIGNFDARRDLAELRGSRCFIVQPGTWFRRSVFDRFGYLDESYHFAFDYEFFLRMAGKVKARFVPDVVSNFRVHPSSKTGSQHGKFLPEQWRAFRSHGGRINSPFVLDALRNTLVMPAVGRMTRPLRHLLWRVLGLKPGTKVRVG